MLSIVVSRKPCSITKADKLATAADREPWRIDPNLEGINREVVWQSAEADALLRLAAAGVRVPKSYGLIGGVLLMELITGADGEVAQA